MPRLGQALRPRSEPCAAPQNQVLRGAGALELRVGRSQFNGYFLSQIDALLPQIISLQLFDNFPFG